MSPKVAGSARGRESRHNPTRVSGVSDDGREWTVAPDGQSATTVAGRPTGSARWALESARRLHVVATIILVIVSALAFAALLGGGVEAAIANTHTDRVAGGVAAGCGVVAWLSGALPCMAAQAFARYIEFRADQD